MTDACFHSEKSRNYSRFVHPSAFRQMATSRQTTHPPPHLLRPTCAPHSRIAELRPCGANNADPPASPSLDRNATSSPIHQTTATASAASQSAELRVAISTPAIQRVAHFANLLRAPFGQL